MMKSVIFIAALFVVVAAAESSVAFNKGQPYVECGLITDCDACAQKQYVNSATVRPCHWDWITNSCGFYKNEDHICDGNQGYPTMECNRCKKRAEDKKKADAARAAAANGGGSAAGAPGSAGAGGAGGKKARNRCQVAEAAGGIPLKGFCVFSPDQCKHGGVVSHKTTVTGCTFDPKKTVCCAPPVKNSRAAKNDSCNSLSNQCSKCVAKSGCVFHKHSGMCISHRGNLARAGANAIIGDATFCYQAGEAKQQKETARQARIAARRAGKGKGKF